LHINNNEIYTTMKTIIPAVITTSEHAKQFLTDLFNNGEAYHPEDSAFDIVVLSTEHRAFTDNEAEKLNEAMEQVYDVADFDPCELLMDLGMVSL